MGVVISKPAINIREQLTELKAQQGYEEQQFHFDNLVTNGTFDTDTSGWTAANSTLSVVSEKLRVTWATATSPRATQQILSEGALGKTYAYSVDVGDINGGTAAELWIGQSATNPNYANPQNISPNSTVTGVFTATNSQLHMALVFNGDGTGHYADFDNISIYPSDGTDVAFAMPKGWKPLHVYDDGVLQREGSAEDYEVTFDGFNYYVKPTVANPGARNTVIGVRA